MARAVLEALAADQPALEAVRVSCVKPETGAGAENILALYAPMLRPGQTLSLPVRSPDMVFRVIEGGVMVQIEDQRFMLAEADSSQNEPPPWMAEHTCRSGSCMN